MPRSISDKEPTETASKKKSVVTRTRKKKAFSNIQKLKYLRIIYKHNTWLIYIFFNSLILDLIGKKNQIRTLKSVHA